MENIGAADGPGRHLVGTLKRPCLGLGDEAEAPAQVRGPARAGEVGVGGVGILLIPEHSVHALSLPRSLAPEFCLPIGRVFTRFGAGACSTPTCDIDLR